MGVGVAVDHEPHRVGGQEVVREAPFELAEGVQPLEGRFVEREIEAAEVLHELWYRACTQDRDR